MSDLDYITKLEAENETLRKRVERAERQSLAALRVANSDRNREWDPEGRIGLAFRGLELAGEAGEACNVLKKLERQRMGIRGSKATRLDLAHELADVVICADLIAMQCEINLTMAIEDKFNLTSEKYQLLTRL